MIWNYFKIAWRNLFRNKGYALMNIVGLSIGMTAAILIGLWIQDELGYDRFYPTTDRLYQVYSKDVFDGKTLAWDGTPGSVAPAIQKDYPEIEDAARYLQDNYLLSVGEKKLNVKGAIADTNFLKVFGLPVLSGNPGKALSDAKGIVITQRLAKKLFGTTQALGETLRVENKEDRTVTAIIEDFPSNSRFHEIEYILPFRFLLQFWEVNWDKSWTAFNFETYVLLKPGMQYSSVNSKIKNTILSHTNGSGNPVKTEIFLHPAAKWKLYSKQENGHLVAGEISNVWRMGQIAIFILLIACINFMNLSTARSEKRAKEVGIRKVAGATRGSLIFQFIGESVLLAFLSGIIAFLLVLAFLPSFNLLVDKSLAIPTSDPIFWISALGFILFTGLLAGSYPAIFLSSFVPVKVLKGSLKASHSFFNPRKLLVVTQFSIAILLIICTIIIKQQMEYTQNRDMGFDKNNLIYSEFRGDLEDHYDLVKQELLTSGAATSVTKSLGPITKVSSHGWGFSWEGSAKEDKKMDFIWLSSDADFLATMGVELVEGRDIDVYRYPTDSTATILNEQAVKAMNLKNPIGAIIRNGNQQWHVIGVVKDFILGSPYEPIAPLMIQGPASWFNYINIRLNPNNAVADNLKRIEGVFKTYNPQYPFEYSFTDKEYQRKFKGVQVMGSLVDLFSGLTIFIACLGLFALAAYTIEQRRKEIGVRKVLGAPVPRVVAMLSMDFLKLVVIAFLIASPIAWLVMNHWLEDYNYRISIQLWVFLVTGVLSILIAVLTISFHTIKAAITNPAKSLRTE